MKSHPFMCLTASPDCLAIDSVDRRPFSCFVRFIRAILQIQSVRLLIFGLVLSFTARIFFVSLCVQQRCLGVWSETVSTHPDEKHDSVPGSAMPAGGVLVPAPPSVCHVQEARRDVEPRRPPLYRAPSSLSRLAGPALTASCCLPLPHSLVVPAGPVGLPLPRH